MKPTAALTPCPLSRDAGEGEPAARCMHATPLSYGVGEGLGVRAKNSGRAAHGDFVSRETPVVLFKPH